MRGIDISGGAATVPGVRAVLTHEDVPGRPVYGMEIADQPVLAIDEVRYQGEPVAIVAADHPETARRAADPDRGRLRAARRRSPAPRPPSPPGAPPAAPGREPAAAGADPPRRPGRRGRGGGARPSTRSGMQDQAFLGPESALAVPAEDGGIDLYIATQWLHVDQGQVAASLGLPLELTRLHLAGVGGAFGGREDLSMQVHVAMLALRTGRPVKMVYSREESFFGHVHRHPAWMELRARRHPRRAPRLRAGPAWCSTAAPTPPAAPRWWPTPRPSPAGPTTCPTPASTRCVAYTNNPPCGAMRGFGAVQVAFAHESQMDRLAAAARDGPGGDAGASTPCATGDRLPTGQVVDGPGARCASCWRSCARCRCRPTARSSPVDLREMPGGVSNTTHGEGTRRGVGFAVGFKNIAFAEGFDDYSTARVRLVPTAEGPRGRDPHARRPRWARGW